MNAYIVIIDGLGIGEMADASLFDSLGADSYGKIKDLCGLPNLTQLGLNSIFGVGVNKEKVIGGYARGRQISNYCDFETGYTEILGKIAYEHTLYSKTLEQTERDYTLLDLLKDNAVNVDFIDETTLDSCFEKINCCNILRRKDLIITNIKDIANKYAEQLSYLDGIIGKIMKGMETSDILVVVGNNGVSLDGRAVAKREYVPIMFYMPKYAIGVDMGTVHGLDAVAMTIADYFGIYTGIKSKLSALKIHPQTSKRTNKKNLLTTQRIKIDKSKK